VFSTGGPLTRPQHASGTQEKRERAGEWEAQKNDVTGAPFITDELNINRPISSGETALPSARPAREKAVRHSSRQWP